MVDEVVIELQKARLMAFMRRFARFTDGDNPDSLMLIGLAVGLRLAAGHPEVAAKMLVELDPPPMEESLEWVVRGSTRVDPDEPVN